MNASVFEHSEYRVFLKNVLTPEDGGRGARSRLAQALGCQSSFISQVLSGKTHLSLEHALKAARHLALGEGEERYFLLLVQKAKAGSVELERYFEKQLKEIQRDRQDIQRRIRVQSDLKGEDQMTYYSAWYYLAIHVLIAFPEFGSKAAIAKRLRLSPALVGRVLDFLVSRGLAVEKGGAYRIGTSRIHLPRGSAMLPRHHSNWRMKAIEAVDEESENDLHFSGVIGLSRKDALRLKAMMLTLVEQTEHLLKETREEAPYCVLLDLFEV